MLIYARHEWSLSEDVWTLLKFEGLKGVFVKDSKNLEWNFVENQTKVRQRLEENPSKIHRKSVKNPHETSPSMLSDSSRSTQKFHKTLSTRETQKFHEIIMLSERTAWREYRDMITMTHKNEPQTKLKHFSASSRVPPFLLFFGTFVNSSRRNSIYHQSFIRITRLWLQGKLKNY
jgi:hypothetical protein